MSPEHGRLFVNVKQRVSDMEPFLPRRPVDRLVGSPLSLQAKVDPGRVVWPGILDIPPDTLRLLSRPAPESRATGSRRAHSPVLCSLILLCLVGFLPGCGPGWESVSTAGA